MNSDILHLCDFYVGVKARKHHRLFCKTTTFSRLRLCLQFFFGNCFAQPASTPRTNCAIGAALHCCRGRQCRDCGLRSIGAAWAQRGAPNSRHSARSSKAQKPSKQASRLRQQRLPRVVLQAVHGAWRPTRSDFEVFISPEPQRRATPDRSSLQALEQPHNVDKVRVQLGLLRSLEPATAVGCDASTT